MEKSKEKTRQELIGALSTLVNRMTEDELWQLVDDAAKIIAIRLKRNG